MHVTNKARHYMMYNDLDITIHNNIKQISIHTKFPTFQGRSSLLCFDKFYFRPVYLTTVITLQPIDILDTE